MSELKEFEVGLGQMFEDGSPVVIAVDENNNPRLLGNEKVYLKSEADKVIAELKEDYKEACDRLQTANLIKYEQLAASRHHKHRRCMLMAELCEERSARYDELQERTGFSWSKEINFYFRWHMRWLKIAEKFKDVK